MDTTYSSQPTDLHIINNRARRTIVAWWVFLGTMAISLIAALLTINIVHSMGYSTSAPLIKAVLVIMVLLPQFLTFICTLVFFMIWIHGYIKNLIAMGITDLRFSPTWAVWCFFIPVINLWKPYQVLREMWLASEKHNNPNVLQGVRPPLHIMWWHLIMLGYYQLLNLQLIAKTPGIGAGWAYTFILATIWAGMTINLIRQLQERINRIQQILVEGNEA